MIPRKTARFTQPLVARAQALAPHQLSQRRWVLAGSLALLAGAAVFSASGVHAQATASGVQVPVVAVGAQAVGAGVVLDGSLQAVRQSVLSAQASGRIASLSVKAGDRVVVDGFQKFAAGDTVTPRTVTAQAPPERPGTTVSTTR